LGSVARFCSGKQSLPARRGGSIRATDGEGGSQGSCPGLAAPPCPGLPSLNHAQRWQICSWEQSRSLPSEGVTDGGEGGTVQLGHIPRVHTAHRAGRGPAAWLAPVLNDGQGLRDGEGQRCSSNRFSRGSKSELQNGSFVSAPCWG